ncbi:MAG: hypothetical protein ACJ8GN_17930 [Longimicrobiaceae bacterium]
MGKRSARAAQGIDGWLFVKNGYSAWMHTIPFGVAALLLLTFSVSQEDPLKRLVELLSSPGWPWIPAGLVTVVSALVYVLTIRHQIRRAYLWPEHTLRRTLTTALVYLALAFGATYGVLRMAVPGADASGGTLACLILSLLSLAGLGWTMPQGWVDDIGIRSPDYLRARNVAAEVARLLTRLRSEAVGRRQDVAHLQELVSAMRDEIEANVDLEPTWAKDRTQRFSSSLHALLLALDARFANDDAAVADFPAAWKGQKKQKYQDFAKAVEAVVAEWPAWKHDPPATSHAEAEHG